MAAALVVALIGLPLLPPTHVHRAGIESRSAAIAHSHVIADQATSEGAPRGASLAPPHGNHGNAVFLVAAYEPTAGSTLITPPLIVGRVVISAPEPVRAGVVAPSGAPAPRGSPSPPDPVRGPPSRQTLA